MSEIEALKAELAYWQRVIGDRMGANDRRFSDMVRDLKDTLRASAPRRQDGCSCPFDGCNPCPACIAASVHRSAATPGGSVAWQTALEEVVLRANQPSAGETELLTKIADMHRIARYALLPLPHSHTTAMTANPRVDAAWLTAEHAEFDNIFAAPPSSGNADAVREALQLGLDAVTQTFEHVETKDDLLLAQMRHEAISAVLANAILAPSQGDAVRAALNKLNHCLNERLAGLKGYRMEEMRLHLSEAYTASAALSSAPVAGESEDTKLLDALKDESWDLRCFDMPTGGGDADVGWRVIGHWQAVPCERIVGEAFHDDPRAAIRDALSRNDRGGPAT